MKTDKPFWFFIDLWEEEDVTESIFWGLCGLTSRPQGTTRRTVSPDLFLKRPF